MFQLARQKQRHIEPVRAPAATHAPAITVGKLSLTAQLEAKHLGAPDYYTQAIDSAQRELNAVRATALPAFVAIRRKQDLAPLTKQIELARAAMQVRYLLMAADNHVFALEFAATHKDPLVLYLRARLDQLVARATTLGVYRDAEDMIPRGYVEERPKQSTKQKVALEPTRHKPRSTKSIYSPTTPAQITRQARTRLARGTAPIMTMTAGAPAEQRTSGASIRPGFRR